MRTPFPIENLEEITSDEADRLLSNSKYWLQVKSDGVFAQIQKLGRRKYIRFNKLGNLVTGSLSSLIVNDLEKIKAKTFFVAGELMGESYIVENLLEINGTDYSENTYQTRFTRLESLIVPAKLRHVTTPATWKTTDEKIIGRAALQKNRYEGEVFKLISAPYKVGNSGQHKKFKYVKTLSAIVTGLGHKGHNSATLGLFDTDWKDQTERRGEARIVEVGRCSLNGKQAVKISDVVEVRYLYATSGRRLYQPRLLKVRDDVEREKCTVDQLIYQQGVEL